MLNKLKLTRILIVGDLMLDRYWHGDTARISPEAPVPVVRVRDEEYRAGGLATWPSTPPPWARRRR